MLIEIYPKYILRSGPLQAIIRVYTSWFELVPYFVALNYTIQNTGYISMGSHLA